MHVMLNGVHTRSLEAIERAPQGMATEVRPGRRRRLPDRCRMPRGSRIDPLPSAELASESSACLGDHNCLRQCVQVHVGFMVAGLASRDDGVDAILAHVRKGHGRPGLFARDHP
jgi:hypothetical protein